MCAPLRAARFAASTFVSMPPFDIALPVPPAIDSSAASPAVASATSVASGFAAGIRREEARLIGEDHEHVRLDQVGDEGASVSLSPNLISSVTTVSFSLMTGTTPSASSVNSVERALR